MKLYLVRDYKGNYIYACVAQDLDRLVNLLNKYLFENYGDEDYSEDVGIIKPPGENESGILAIYSNFLDNDESYVGEYLNVLEHTFENDKILEIYSD